MFIVDGAPATHLPQLHSTLSPTLKRSVMLSFSAMGIMMPTQENRRRLH